MACFRRQKKNGTIPAANIGDPISSSAPLGGVLLRFPRERGWAGTPQSPTQESLRLEMCVVPVPPAGYR